jgi:hypothetical protein
MKILRQWAEALAHGDGDPVQPRPTPQTTREMRSLL